MYGWRKALAGSGVDLHLRHCKRANVTFCLAVMAKAKSVSHHRYPQVIKHAARHGNRYYRAVSFPESRSVWQSSTIFTARLSRHPPAGAVGAFSCSPQLLAKTRGHRCFMKKSKAQKTGRHAGLTLHDHWSVTGRCAFTDGGCEGW